MELKNIVKFTSIILLATLFLLTSCTQKNKDLDPNRPLTAEEKRKKNIAEGRGATLGSLLGNRGSTNFFLSVNSNFLHNDLSGIFFYFFCRKIFHLKLIK